MNDFIVKCAYVLFIILLVFQSAPSQQKAPPGWRPNLSQLEDYKSSFAVALSSEDKKKMETLWNEIGEDLKKSQNAIAGTYVHLNYEGGFFLRWTVNKGFILIPYFDQSMIQDFSYGKVKFIDKSEIIFIPERDITYGRPFKKLPRKWTVFSGGFVPIDKLKDAGLFRAGLGEYNEYNGDCCDSTPNFINRKIEGNLTENTTPAKYRRFLKNAIHGQIIYIGKKKIVTGWGLDKQYASQSTDKTALIPIKVNVGRKHGVKKKMLFSLVDGLDFNRSQYLQIMKVSEKTSEGFIVRAFNYDDKEAYHDHSNDTYKPFPEIKVGTKISTNEWNSKY